MIPTTFETKRLKLCICTRLHAPLVLDFYRRNFDDLKLYEPITDSAKTLNYHKSSLAYEYQLFEKKEFVRFYMFEKTNPLTVIGTVSYRSIQRYNYDSCIIGYKVDKNFRRLGYAHEAIARTDRIMFEDYSLHRIEANVLPDNQASINLLLSLNYQNEGLLREKIRLQGEWKDHYMFSHLSTDLIPS